MSRSESDIRRRELGVIIKHDPKQAEPIEDYYARIPDGGCQYYGSEDLMILYCKKCSRLECY